MFKHSIYWEIYTKATRYLLQDLRAIINLALEGNIISSCNFALFLALKKEHTKISYIVIYNSELICVRIKIKYILSFADTIITEFTLCFLNISSSQLVKEFNIIFFWKKSVAYLH